MPGIKTNIGVGKFHHLGALLNQYAALRPSSLSAIAVSPTQINLSWVNNSLNGDGVKIYYSTDNVVFTLLGTVARNINTYQATGLTTASSYYYFYVISYKGTVESIGSRVAVNEESLLLFNADTLEWYNPSDLSTITKDESGLMSAYASKSGTGHTLLQANDANKPSHTPDRTVSFDSSHAKFLKANAFALNQPIFIYAILNHKVYIAGNRIWTGNLSGDGVFYLQANRYYMYNGANLYDINNDDLPNKWQVIKAFYNGATSKIQVDGNIFTSGNSGTANFGGLSLGSNTGSESAEMELMDVVIRANANNENEVYDYLNKKKIRFMTKAFKTKYDAKTMNTHKQLNVVFSGDSILGRMNATEIAYTPGYDTGLFPPNMGQQLVAYKVLQHLQYPNSDVKYYNLLAWEKSAGWGLDKVTADNLKIWQTDTLNEYAEITITGASYFKLLYYTDNVAANQIAVTFNGASPSSLGLTGGDTVTTPNGTVAANFYKWGNTVWSGLNPAETYVMRITNTGGGKSQIWGGEAWSNERINAIVAAHGGYTAAEHLSHLQNFSGAMYNPDLIIHSLPVINDTNPSGKSLGGKLFSDATVTATTGQFIFALESGTYTNFGGLVLTVGSYAEWNGSAWVAGSSWVNSMLANFTTNLAYLDTINTNGIPVVFIIPHYYSGEAATRPWGGSMRQILRNKLSDIGHSYIDFDDMSMGGSTSDGVHLNNVGVGKYFKEIIQVLP